MVAVTRKSREVCFQTLRQPCSFFLKGGALFIKWRTYQRQLNGVKGDKYIQQPIIVKSYRLGKKKLKEMFPDLTDDDLEKLNRPRHKIVCKLPPYEGCMLVYFRNPRFMSDRILWWLTVEGYLNLLEVSRKDVTKDIVQKLKDDIEKVVPRVTEKEMKKLKVVLNDLPLHL